MTTPLLNMPRPGASRTPNIQNPSSTRAIREWQPRPEPVANMGGLIQGMERAAKRIAAFQIENAKEDFEKGKELAYHNKMNPEDPREAEGKWQQKGMDATTKALTQNLEIQNMDFAYDQEVNKKIQSYQDNDNLDKFADDQIKYRKDIYKNSSLTPQQQYAQEQKYMEVDRAAVELAKQNKLNAALEAQLTEGKEHATYAFDKIQIHLENGGELDPTMADPISNLMTTYEARGMVKEKINLEFKLDRTIKASTALGEVQTTLDAGGDPRQAIATAKVIASRIGNNAKLGELRESTMKKAETLVAEAERDFENTIKSSRAVLKHGYANPGSVPVSVTMEMIQNLPGHEQPVHIYIAEKTPAVNAYMDNMTLQPNQERYRAARDQFMNYKDSVLSNYVETEDDIENHKTLTEFFEGYEKDIHAFEKAVAVDPENATGTNIANMEPSDAKAYVEWMKDISGDPFYESKQNVEELDKLSKLALEGATNGDLEANQQLEEKVKNLILVYGEDGFNRHILNHMKNPISTMTLRQISTGMPTEQRVSGGKVLAEGFEFMNNPLNEMTKKEVNGLFEDTYGYGKMNKSDAENIQAYAWANAANNGRQMPEEDDFKAGIEYVLGHIEMVDIDGAGMTPINKNVVDMVKSDTEAAVNPSTNSVGDFGKNIEYDRIVTDQSGVFVRYVDNDGNLILNRNNKPITKDLATGEIVGSKPKYEPNTGIVIDNDTVMPVDGKFEPRTTYDSLADQYEERSRNILNSLSIHIQSKGTIRADEWEQLRKFDEFKQEQSVMEWAMTPFGIKTAREEITGVIFNEVIKNGIEPTDTYGDKLSPLEIVSDILRKVEKEENRIYGIDVFYNEVDPRKREKDLWESKKQFRNRLNRNVRVTDKTGGWDLETGEKINDSVGGGRGQPAERPIGGGRGQYPGWDLNQEQDFKTGLNSDSVLHNASNDTLNMIARNADRLNIPRDIAYGLAFTESSLRHRKNDGNTVMGDGGKSTGLFQIQPAALQDTITAGLMPADTDLNDEEQNIMAGLSYLALMKQQAGGDINKAIRMYNGGPRAANIPGLANNYLQKVSTAAKKIKQDLDGVG